MLILSSIGKQLSNAMGNITIRQGPMRWLIVLLLGFVCWLLPTTLPMLPGSSGVALAVTISSETALARLFTSSEIQASWFANSFLSQISLTQIEQVVQGITATLGQYQSVEARGNQYLLTFLQDADGHHYCIAATWNNPDGIAELKFSGLYRGALSLIKSD
ncbi:hypothetical protein DXZ20_10575 [Leptolyngbyaceae cyanobacterium CCMR0081]|uniref:Uncharacterized protein n=2 Tax=Adonisia TaxID=2950183 RepID=A0A6M0RIW8_9CYAN|nr:hypothetical protein [Adonisia turfae CCMR0081]